ncbi:MULTISPECIES: nitrogen fixation protein NifQ [Bradyrhizobium]|uniref:Nitrogen fixation protein NifQ n=1 Tax=Bradyrhizobium frederickii TaxID=2560054 RepID=A0A4Y9KTX1_9BRAD|nr:MULTISPECIES: nitrogen fixation protein NifQ [Bradyrhizobium]RTE88461.1 nitrogen fixation protein NifQ [Bradyrhizobium sp. LVM 105]TFV30555.1 nitrogen fixation protein NifQ [Bradyrhizobium frederickii]TFV68722.1 nitrogen fixation protein NifQ [Bradyrhizobium frederickii]
MFEAQYLPFMAACAVDANSQIHRGIATYRLLTGVPPADADIAIDSNFDRHVLASILAAATMDGGSLPEKTGLSGLELAALLEQYFPSLEIKLAGQLSVFKCEGDEEIAMLRDLLLKQRSTERDIGHWLAAMIARRAIEPGHLWEALGLRNRGELSRLLSRHFAPLASRNVNNMRWKRFFYRMLCENEGLAMCTTPVCNQCDDFNICFGEESGESRMAERRRDFLLQAARPVVAGGWPSEPPQGSAIASSSGKASQDSVSRAEGRGRG